MKHISILSLSLLAALLATASAAEPPKLAPVLQPFVDDHTLAGAVVLVADTSKVLALEAVGSADIAAKKPMRTDSLFWIASQSKPLTCTALMILVDEGKVNVDDPVEKYLPEFKGQLFIAEQDENHKLLKKPARTMRVRDVMSHTSGLPGVTPVMQPTLDGLPLEKTVLANTMVPLESEPGTKYKYSNPGINTVGRMVEVVSGMPYERFMDERIFKPLGMKDTTFWPSEEQISRLAKSYKPNADKSDLEETTITSLRYPLGDRTRYAFPGGGLFSTATDLSLFYRMIANNGALAGTRILSEKSVEQMTTDQTGEAKSAYGFGFGTNGRFVTHGGAYSTNSRLDREQQLITIFLVQHAGWPRNGKDILPAFQKAATEAFGSKKTSSANTADAHLTVGISSESAARAGASRLVALGAAAPLTNSIGMKLVPVAPGAFTMGQDGPAADYNVKVHAAKFDDADWDERPAHRVTIGAAFFIGATEVTLAQYRKFQPKHAGGRGADDDAVSGVSWDDAVKFCAWLSAKEKRTYRLPTKAEWEYACRAGTTTLFHTGDRLPDGFHQWFTDSGLRDRFFPDGKFPAEYRSGKGSLRVAQTPANAWGLFDMHGNAAEWCADWYGPYEAAEQADPLGRSDGDFRVIRGGAHSMQTRLLRSANRSAWLPQTGNEKTGFRVVLGELPRGQTHPPVTPLHARDVSQSLAKIAAPPADVPLFAGPKPFVKIPPNSFGPLFSWHNHSPAIAECPNGDLLAVWYSCVDEAGTELNNLASRLRRGATEWEPASLFWDGADVNDHAPKLWWDGGRTLFHFARGLAENIVRTSTDNGATWTKAREMQPMGEFGNAPIRTREGAMVITQDVTSTSVNLSRDGGATWSFPAITEKMDARRDGSPARHAGIHAPIVQLADGSLMTIGRLNTVPEQEKFGGKTPASFSSDWGKTWTHAPTEFPAISSVQRAVLLRLREGPLLLCSFTDQRGNWKERKGITFKAADGTDFTGYGLFAAVSFDDGKTWPARKLITPGGPERSVPSIDRGEFTLSDTMAESGGYLAATQTRDGNVQLVSSKNHYVFNLAWLKELPRAPGRH